MKLNGEELKALLEELYAYYYGVAKSAFVRDGDASFDYDETKAFGAMVAICTICLACFGAREMMQLWLENCESDPAASN